MPSQLSSLEKAWRLRLYLFVPWLAFRIWFASRWHDEGDNLYEPLDIKTAVGLARALLWGRAGYWVPLEFDDEG